VAHLQANGRVERANGLVLDGLKKRLYDEHSKKGGKWINGISSVIWGLRTQSSKAIGQSPFFLIYGSEAILPADVMWQPRQYEEGEAGDARHSNSTRQKKSDTIFCSSRPTTYKESVVTMIGTFNDAFSTLEIWFFDVSRMKPGCTSLIRDGRDPSSCTRLQDQGCTAYTTLMARRSQALGISSIYDIFILSQSRHLHVASYTELLNPMCRISSSLPSGQP
jgi:hypothetical protein